MSRPFESFEFLNRGWDIRLLEQQSLRWVFVALLVDAFMLGTVTFMMVYEWFHLQHFDWTGAILAVLFGVSVLRYTPILYRRLGQ